MNNTYKIQAELLLDILPNIAEETKFALHGGTAINLFHLNMPRLSVDIDLTYIPFGNDRNSDMQIIRTLLENIKIKLKKSIPSIHFSDRQKTIENLKIVCTSFGATVKIEVNQINRGLFAESRTMILQ
jgi:predicted nucleotidyltransferase component of viral defense system